MNLHLRIPALLVTALLTYSSLGQTVPPKGTEPTFDIGIWNIEWFGSGNGPSNDALQFSNVLAVLRQADIDLWAFQEISDPLDYLRLVDSLGVNYGMALATYSQSQKTAYLFKKDVVSVRSISHVLETFDFDFAGRPPLELEASITSGGTVRIVTFINLHMKATSNQDSFNRRLSASGRLKNHVDFTSLESEAVVILGDLNDRLDRSITSGNDTPYRNFVDDATGYRFLTAELQADGRATFCGNSCSSGSTIDHILITNELFDFYETGSVDHYDEVLTGITAYLQSTSDHLPVFARFNLASTSARDEPARIISDVSVFPNPFAATSSIQLRTESAIDISVSIVDALGRLVSQTRTLRILPGTTTLPVDLKPNAAGTYFARIQTDEQVEFVKLTRLGN